ncbi:MAG: GNAT family N-acetyltransferase [Tateyamaria sp.]
MSIVFREANSADIPAILNLLRDDMLGSAREHAEPQTYMRAFRDVEADPKNTIVVGDQGGEVVACYQLTFIPGLSLRASRRAQLEGVRVAGHMRGQRIGAAMIADAEARARAAGCTLMQLTMNKGRTDTARFYARVGFTPSHIGYKRDLT